MKKIICILLLTLLCGCTAQTAKTPEKSNAKAVRGVWISYSEINGITENPEEFKTRLDTVVENCKETEIDIVYLHVRAFCDSLYPSEYFPLCTAAQQYDYDLLEYIISQFHAEDIAVHAWINPYRVRTADSDASALPENSPARVWLNDDDSSNDTNVCLYNGVYLNPASAAVQRLVMDGIREIISKYEVDGIHFDDYFYPTADAEFDAVAYEAYRAGCENPLSLGDWRRAAVNALVSGCRTAISYTAPSVVFSISPSASISRNYNELFADIKAWVKSGCVDYIIPQLYFGFEYPDESYRFESLLNEWEDFAKQNDAKLFVGLAAYKIGTDTAADKEEWNRDSDILARQAAMCEKSKYCDGCVFFSYNSLFSDNELNKEQRKNLFGKNRS